MQEEHCYMCQENDNSLFETSHWRVTLAPEQSYLGRFYVTAKRHVGDLAELTEEEHAEWLDVVRTMQDAIRQAFGATMFNWGCLMNFAYKNAPPNPHVHWHVRPRYDHPVNIASMEFTDPDFGDHYSRERKVYPPSEVLEVIRGHILGALGNHRTS